MRWPRGFRYGRRARQLAAGLAAAAVAAVVAAGCGGSTPTQQGGGASPGAAGGAPAANAPYAIGAFVDETGPGSSLGRPEADSIQLAVDEINRQGGVNGHPLQVTILDSKSDATTGVEDAKQLLAQHVVALIGGTLTPASLAVVPVAQQAKVPFISLASAAQVVEPVEDRHWVFKMPPTDPTVAKTMQRFMKAQGWLKVGFVYRNDDYGKSGLAHFEQAGKADGFTVVASEAIEPTVTDATPQITRIRAASPQAIVVWSTPPSADVVAKGYQLLGLKVPLLFSDGSANGVFLKLGGSAVEGAVVAGTKIGVADQLPDSDPQKQVLQHYIQAFEQAYPKDAPASMFGGFGYDAVYVVRDALAKAGPDPAKVRDALEQTQYSGVTGVYRITAQDHNGLPADSVILARVNGGKWQLIPAP
jgi:branched-chain amino acid transport system substrate-binding protein